MFDQPQSDVVVFAIIYFGKYIYLVTEWKHGVYINYIVTFCETLGNSLTVIIEPTNIDESSNE